jgi:thiol-disulfide isomerase/thioredoxin
VTVVFEILAVLLTLLVGFQLYILAQARRNRGRAVADLPGELGAAVASGRKVVAYVWSPNCSSCRVQAPIIDRLSRDFPDVYTVNAIEDRATVAALGILGTPTTIVFAGGVMKEYFVGVKSEERLRRALS